MNAAIYARVSTKEQAEEGFSISAQLRAMRDYCRAQGWEVGAEFIDEGVSAAHESAARRPQFRRLLAEVETHRYGVVMVHKLDRFSRNLIVTLQSLSRIDKAGATFVSVTEQLDYTTATGKLFLTMLGGLAQWYSDNLAFEVRKGRRERTEQGLPNGDLPFGYVSTGDPHEPPVVIPAEAEMVATAFSLYSSGTQSAHQIAGWFNDQHVRPRSKRKLTRFTKATVMDMLSNPFYKGSVRYRGEELPGRHEACVTPELWDRVQRTRMMRRRMTPALTAHPRRIYLLQSVAHCVSCGRLLTCNTPKAGPRYRDASRDKHQECGAQRQSVVCDVVDTQIGEIFRQLKLPADWTGQLQSLAVSGEKPSDVPKRRRSTRERLKRLSELYLDGDIPKSRYDQERATLHAQLEALDAESIDEGTIEKAAKVIDTYASIWDAADDSERASITKTVFEAVFVDLDTATILYLKPRAAFLPLFQTLCREKLLHGDPERIRTADLHLDRVAC